MIENVETYNCEEINCGRKFRDFSTLLDHYKRRHPSVYKTYEKRKNFFDELTSQIENFEKDAREAIIIDKDREEIIENSMIEIKDYEEENHNESHTDFKETKSTCITDTSTNKNKEQKLTIISEEMIGIGTLYADYTDIEAIDLEDKSIMCFRHKRNLNFNHLNYLTQLNLSRNFLKDINDLQKLTNIIILNISYNSIDDISCLEYLESLEVLKAENNEIRSISSLNKCGSLKCLELANNKIMYEQSTYSTINFLKNMKFLDDVIGYKHLFLNKYPKLTKLDGCEISDLDREIANRFLDESDIKENKEGNSEEGDNFNLDSNSKTDITSNAKENPNRLNSKVKIEKIKFKPEQISLKDNVKQKSAHPLKKFILNKIPNSSKSDYIYLHQIDQLKKDMNELRLENDKLVQINRNNEIEMNSLKTELENLNNINREYEKIIEDYKKKSNENVDTDTITKLKKEVESWKTEYFDLLNKNMNIDVNKSVSLDSSTIFFNEINSKRPQTSDHMNNSDKLNHENKFLHTASSFNKIKNSLDDSLNNSIEDINDNDILRHNFQTESKKDKIDLIQDDEDDEIEELLRKSSSNLKSLKQEIKNLNKDLNNQRQPKSEHATSLHKEIVNPSTEKRLNPLKTINKSHSKPKVIRDNIDAKIKLPLVIKNKK